MAIKREKNLTRPEAMEIFHQDGVLEVVMGATLLNFGFDLLNQMSFTSLFTYIPIVLMSAMKNQITISRIGYDAFDGDETSVRNWNLITAAGMVIILVALSLFVLNDTLKIRELISFPETSQVSSLLTGLVLALGSLAGAVFLPLKRFYAYAAAALVIGVVGMFLFPPQVAAFAIAGVLLGNGVRMMIQFSRKYPLKKDDMKNEGKKK
ncbi:MAG: hypothetical protein FJZ98_02635 [Chloroflexi bacterium]|nr:hypothetical protein [Chloroflexota bacterium]